MKNILKSGLLLASLCCAVPAMAKVTVFACEPEWQALAEKIGGEHVKTFSATTAKQNPHYISARPSLLAKMRRSDVVICSGSGLEAGWLPVLLQSAGSADVQPGGRGHFMASDAVEKLEVITDVSLIDRAKGDIHPDGNPHIHLDPHRLLPVAAELRQRLQALAPAHAEYFQQREQAFAKAWQLQIAGWEQRAAALRGKPVIVYHKDWAYLADWLGLNVVGTIEPKPGIAPSAGHLAKLVQQHQNQPIHAILYAPFQDDEPPTWLADKLNTRAVMLPYTVGDEAKSLIELFEKVLKKLQ